MPTNQVDANKALLKLLADLNVRSAQRALKFRNQHSIASMVAMLKELYSDELVQGMVFKDNPLLKLLGEQDG